MNVRHSNGHRRRQVVAQVLAEEDQCALCHLVVDKTLKLDPHGKPHPMSPEVDEIIPVSLGGSPFERSNCQLTHRRCNRAKSNHVIVSGNSAVTSENVKLLPLSRSW